MNSGDGIVGKGIINKIGFDGVVQFSLALSRLATISAEFLSRQQQGDCTAWMERGSKV